MINDLVDLLFHTLMRVQAAASLAIVLVLLLRAPARRLIGADLAYRFWALPIAAGIASLFPTLSEFTHGVGAIALPTAGLFTARLDGRIWLAVWAFGALLFSAALLICESRFQRGIALGTAGPAVTGVGWHRLITPQDFMSRFNALERDFILRHERMHIARHDPSANLLIGLLQVLSWFNPLAHLAARAARLDQELACDEAVIRHHPELRKGYAQTLLKAQLSRPHSPFACAFAGTRHPLELRLAMLARPQPGLTRQLAGAAAVSAIGLVLATAVWATAPQDHRHGGCVCHDHRKA